MSGYVRSLDALSQADVRRCGGKAAGLGELMRLGLQVPPGFCILGDALAFVVGTNALGDRITQLAAGFNFEDYADVESRTAAIRALIASANIPGDLEREVRAHFSRLVAGDDQYVAVRSSVAVQESDLSSFPGMMDTYHYVLGERDVLSKIRECWASLWTARAAYARHQRHIAHERAVIAPIVQLMVHADVAGVLFTANPITRNTGELVIEANWGLGESVVSGKSMNDCFVLDKATLAVRSRRIAAKTVMVTRNDDGTGSAERSVPPDRVNAPTLSESALAALGKAARRVEDHFGFQADIEWAFQDGVLYVLQARKIRGLGEVGAVTSNTRKVM